MGCNVMPTGCNAIDAAMLLHAGSARTAAEQAQQRKELDLLWKLTHGTIWDTQTDTQEAYQKSVPSGAVAAEIGSIGGKTVVWNQLVDTDTEAVTTVSGRKYLTSIGGTDTIITSDGTDISVTGGTDKVFDLTLMYGENVPPTTSDPRIAGIIAYAEEHPEYDAGSLLSAAVTGVVCKRKTVEWNQLYKRNFTKITSSGVTLTPNNTDGTITLDGTHTGSAGHNFGHSVNVAVDHKYLMVNTVISGTYAGEWKFDTQSFGTCQPNSAAIVTSTKIGGWVFTIWMNYNKHPSFSDCKIRVSVVDLTQMFGSGNEPSSTSDPRIAAIVSYAEAHPEYNESQIIAQTTVGGQVVFTPDITVATLDIPDAVRALEGYGQSEIGGSGNVLDLADGTYTEVGHYVDGVWTALDTPVTVDVSSMLPDNMLDAEAGGTLTFRQEGTELAVPNSVDYLIKLSEVTP